MRTFLTLGAMVAVLFSISAVSTAQEAIASDQPLAGSQLKQLVNGKRIYLKIPLGGEFPLYYQTNGRVTGDGSKTGLGRYFAPKETGKWFVEGTKLCQQFPTWYKGRVNCFTIQKTGATSLRWKRDDGYSGRARIEG